MGGGGGGHFKKSPPPKKGAKNPKKGLKKKGTLSPGEKPPFPRGKIFLGGVKTQGFFGGPPFWGAPFFRPGGFFPPQKKWGGPGNQKKGNPF